MGKFVFLGKLFAQLWFLVNVTWSQNSDFKVDPFNVCKKVADVLNDQRREVGGGICINNVSFMRNNLFRL